MSGGGACKCKKPDRQWRVTLWRANRSAFNGYCLTSSPYSAMVCLACGHRWRTRAAYADQLMETHGQVRVEWNGAGWAVVKA